MNFTVLGHSGFIGREVVRELKKRNLSVTLPERNADLRKKDLGKIIYCIGLTGDAKSKPFETIEAHINKLSDIIRYSAFQDITYASSARVYIHDTEKVYETGFIPIDVSDPFELFNLTKLTAESLLLNTVPNFKIVRYSNVYGADMGSENFLTSILTDCIKNGYVIVNTTPESAKDYISVTDAAMLTVDISISGKNRIYNIASGRNTTNREITDKISQLLNCKIIYSDTAKEIIFPVIDNGRIREEFNFQNTAGLEDDLNTLISTFSKELK